MADIPRCDYRNYSLLSVRHENLTRGIPAPGSVSDLTTLSVTLPTHQNRLHYITSLPNPGDTVIKLSDGRQLVQNLTYQSWVTELVGENSDIHLFTEVFDNEWHLGEINAEKEFIPFSPSEKRYIRNLSITDLPTVDSKWAIYFRESMISNNN